MAAVRAHPYKNPKARKGTKKAADDWSNPKYLDAIFDHNCPLFNDRVWVCSCPDYEHRGQYKDFMTCKHIRAQQKQLMKDKLSPKSGTFCALSSDGSQTYTISVEPREGYYPKITLVPGEMANDAVKDALKKKGLLFCGEPVADEAFAQQEE